MLSHSLPQPDVVGSHASVCKQLSAGSKNGAGFSEAGLLTGKKTDPEPELIAA